ncbi:DNA-binding NarL/FixJ family response regulator [Pedobacter africanus]
MLKNKGLGNVKTLAKLSMATKTTNLESQQIPFPNECCPVFIKYFEGYNYHEIAAALNLPLKTVKERLRNNKRRLRINLRMFARNFRAALHDL